MTNIHYVHFSDINTPTNGTQQQQEQGRYDQLMVASNGNPYVLSPQSSSVPNPQANPLNTQSVNVSCTYLMLYSICMCLEDLSTNISMAMLDILLVHLLKDRCSHLACGSGVL